LRFKRLYAEHLEFDQLVGLDALLVQRTAVPREAVQLLLDWLDQLRLPLIYEIDDALWSVPNDKDEKGFYAAYSPAIRQLISYSRMVLTSTERLAIAIDAMGARVAFMPNRLAEAYWLGDPVENRAMEFGESAGRFRLLYMGQVTHDEDLALLEPVIRELHSEVSGLDFCVLGVSRTAADWYRTVSVPLKFQEYPTFVPWFRSLVKAFDAAVAPLASTPFNNFKSGLRYLDYGAAGLPAVFSNVPSFADVVSHEHNGLLVGNDAQEWLQSLRQLRDDPELRSRLKKSAQNDVLSNFMLTKQLPEWESAILRSV